MTCRSCSVVSDATNTIQYCCRRIQQNRPRRGTGAEFTLPPSEPPLQTLQAASTEPRIEQLEQHLDPIALTSGLLDVDYPVLLDSSLVRPGLGQYSYVTADPFLVVRSKGRQVEVIEHGDVTEQEDNPFSVIQRLLADFGTQRCKDGPPFQGGAIGYFGYEMGGLLERLPGTAVDDLVLPDMNVGFYDWAIAFDHANGRSWLVTTKFSREGRAQWVRDRITEGSDTSTSRNGLPSIASNLRSNFTRERYVEAVKRVKRYIAAGDIYQANISQRFEANVDTDAWTLYQSLRNTAPAPFGAYLGFPESSVLSASPEQFLRVERLRGDSSHERHAPEGS